MFAFEPTKGLFPSPQQNVASSTEWLWNSVTVKFWHVRKRCTQTSFENKLRMVPTWTVAFHARTWRVQNWRTARSGRDFLTIASQTERDVVKQEGSRPDIYSAVWVYLVLLGEGNCGVRLWLSARHITVWLSMLRFACSAELDFASLCVFFCSLQARNPGSDDDHKSLAFLCKHGRPDNIPNFSTHAENFLTTWRDSGVTKGGWKQG